MTVETAQSQAAGAARLAAWAVWLLTVVAALTTLILATTFTPIRQRFESIAAQRFHNPGSGPRPRPS